MKGSITHTNGARHGEPRRCRITGCCHSAFNAIVKNCPLRGFLLGKFVRGQLGP